VNEVHIISSTGYNLFMYWLYKGSTSDLKRRFAEHNTGKNFSTAPYIPLKLIYYEAYLLKSDAESREKYLKTSMGMRVIKKQLANYLRQSVIG
jgi:putative endonuclease